MPAASGGAGCPGCWPDVRADGATFCAPWTLVLDVRDFGRISGEGARCPGPVAFGGRAAVVDDAPGAECPGPGRCSWLLPLVLLIRGLRDLYIFMRIFERALLVPNHAQHLGLR